MSFLAHLKPTSYERKEVWWATKRRCPPYERKEVWWATKRRCPPYELRWGDIGFVLR